MAIPELAAMELNAGPPLYENDTPNEHGHSRVRMLCISSMRSAPAEKRLLLLKTVQSK